MFELNQFNVPLNILEKNETIKLSKTKNEKQWNGRAVVAYMYF